MSAMDGCLVAEELGYGCTGIKTALEASNIGVRIIAFLFLKLIIMIEFLFAFNHKILCFSKSQL